MIKIYCDKCGKEIEQYEPMWNINQQGQYSSKLDGEHIHKQFCDKCLMKFLELDSG
jgi:hypothetical protein